ncbi:arylsulfatase [Flavihumibacter profundi]|uniref:arylsulfatase n=1 Tax=Flavihumibacter profundi TaxID=2716883 RepID=UPI001CC39D49|nr:arylsulfatase [Flavihumibacter profundi]MBZ5858268.1 arylsulfatase [Flavihumibacter profundi]
MRKLRSKIVMMILLMAVVSFAVAQKKQQAAKAPGKPNILVIFGDDIGWNNISAYNMGMMGYKTPNIDRIAKEGMMFTDYYGQQSCTAGRAAFITGQSPYRTGLLKVGLPGAKEGLQKEDPTIADLLKPQGYATGQFGKNHLGDRDEHMPTAHGFDEFFGNLYHLNAEEEPENEDYPTEKQMPGFKEKFGPRGVIHSYANADGTQKIENTGALTKKRMETIDGEFLAAAKGFIDKSVKADKPFFVWYNSTRMHIWTHLKDASKGKTGNGLYADGMAEHDAMVGELLKQLDDLKITDNTIVIYSTDNGAEIMFWPDGGMTPFRGEKATGWEGGFRVPAMIRWPGKIKPGQISNEIFSSEDWMPTLLAAAGVTDIKEKLLTGYQAGNTNYKVHLDGYNQISYLTGQTAQSARKEMFYFNDDGSLVALRYNRWKIHFQIQEHHGFEVWARPWTSLRVPLIFDLQADPFERAEHDSELYTKWLVDHVYLLVPAQAYVGQFLGSFRDFPQRQKVGSFSLDQVLESLQKSGGNN